ncbi:hypothetical protein [uncultured Sphingomonas sp.]|uniref:hypothetical protein n=1 Tax=uncultured Sphingomonas sp. TaxID=158754 RepID=UPI00258D4BA3|nr:hypothetical protein [uncultured Sphingomonas sp.]
MLLFLLLQAVPVATATPLPDDPAKLICRREAVLGTHARRRKVCHTRAEWAEMAQSARNAGNELRTVPQASQN